MILRLWINLNLSVYGLNNLFCYFPALFAPLEEILLSEIRAEVSFAPHLLRPLKAFHITAKYIRPKVNDTFCKIV